MTSDDLFDALERCAATSSKKAKLAIVRELEEFKPWLKYALDSTISYGVANLPLEWSSHGTGTLSEGHVDLLNALANRTLTGNAAEDHIGALMGRLTLKSQQVLRRILLQDLRCGVGATIVGEAFPGLLPVFPYMRCVLEKDSNMHNWDWSEGILVQLKADGMFANVNVTAGGAKVFSRQGTMFPAGALGDLETWLGKLQHDTQTHGELVVYNDGVLLERQVGNGILNSLLKGGELPEKHYVCMDVWDQIPLDAVVDKGRFEASYFDRLSHLVSQVDSYRGCAGDFVQVVETQTAYSKEEALGVYRGYLARGLEGVICKHPNAIWRDGDNKDQVKLKQEVEVDLEIVGYRPGTPGTRTADTFGAVVCRTADGLLEVGVHGFKREIEADIHARRAALIGTVMTVRANGVMKPTEQGGLHSLFLPRFVELRTDKTEADTLERVIDQFEAAVAA